MFNFDGRLLGLIYDGMWARLTPAVQGTLVRSWQASGHSLPIERVLADIRDAVDRSGGFELPPL